MADTKREIERKYEAAPGEEVRLPRLTGVAGVETVTDEGVAELDATYYDTPGLRLAAARITLRRRTGGSDAGWHLKLPVSTGVRDEVRAPLADTVPPELAELVRARTRGEQLLPLLRIRSARDVRHLLDKKGRLLAELSVDGVTAERLGGDERAGAGRARTARWTEVEVELAEGTTDVALLDAVGKRLRKAGLRPSKAPSKLARALQETGTVTGSETGAGTGTGSAAPRAAAAKAGPDTAGGRVLAFVREQFDALLAQDPAVRRDLPDSVHQMRVASRRLRSAFKSFGKVLDRSVTDAVGEELKWLAGELGVDRDQEVLAERLDAMVAEVPDTLLLGPVEARLRIWRTSRGSGARQRTLAALDSDRYTALLDSLEALLADPPLRAPATEPARTVLPKALLKDYDRLAGRVARALALGPGKERDLAMHEARKAAKRARYAGELAVPALGRPAKRFAKRMKAVQTLLGEHQDSVVAREALRGLAIDAHAAGESAFVWGLLHGREEARAAGTERELSAVWEKASGPRIRAALGG
ncbi:CYTH and CHAD domain-containing protein [Streptomyces sp. GC420]|uniref:CYTH and CHAD domain-containing protein n=1 Tax=Streptomyces sp. GC420 TaxID=2697568 RepID=UPI0014151C0A|nr:CYTH and CHAD domain-containing protein [Streptomyces sp. GC420]NBM16686.1 CHAD domain-containing protein [Streptomyces sp. GC420]